MTTIRLITKIKAPIQTVLISVETLTCTNYQQRNLTKKRLPEELQA
jgi:hypothetical protein